MIRPAHLIRRTALIVANLTPDPILARVASIACWLRHDAYFAGAEAAIRGDELPFNVIEFAPAVDELKSVRQAFAQYDEAIQAEEDALRQAVTEYRDHLLHHALVTYYASRNADELDLADYFTWLEQQFHPSNGGAL